MKSVVKNYLSVEKCPRRRPPVHVPFPSEIVTVSFVLGASSRSKSSKFKKLRQEKQNCSFAFLFQHHSDEAGFTEPRNNPHKIRLYSKELAGGYHFMKQSFLTRIFPAGGDILGEVTFPHRIPKNVPSRRDLFEPSRRGDLFGTRPWTLRVHLCY